MDNLLEQINSPDDLRKLRVEQLAKLASQIRCLILASVSRTGGHLASNLGIVELTLAMHYVFDFESDKLLWDVGHQCYTHKIITGRRDKFAKLRQAEGLSGFPNPTESEFDQFAVGHAGTSIATAIGMALGQEQNKTTDKIVALVGDASIVNGLSLEALNNLGLVKRQLLIVLNDNSMAIDTTQGAVAKYFSKIRLSHTYEDMRKTANNILEHIPIVGKGMEDALEKIKKSIRMVIPGSQMFEAMNIPYYGPVNGHDTEALVKLFTELRHLDRPAILHVYTEKGKGFEPAEQDLAKYHSTGPFTVNGNGNGVESAAPLPGRSFTKVFGEKLVELAEKDSKIVAITSAMCDGTGLANFREKFPDRFYDVGIAESAAVDIAAGLAKSGLKPVVCIYSTFLQRGFDQIFQEVALQNLGVVFCIDRAGLVGADGPTHHGLLDTGFLRMMPNLILAAPADEQEVGLALEFAFNQSQPVCLRYPKDLVPDDDFDRSACSAVFEIGKSVTVRKGKDSKVAIVTYGCILTQALKAAASLADDGIEVDVINARFATPVDAAIIGLIEQGKKIITVEDHGRACGFGSAVLEQTAVSDGQMNKTIVVLGTPDEFIKHDKRSEQFIQAGINAENIIKVAKKMIND